MDLSRVNMTTLVPDGDHVYLRLLTGFRSFDTHIDYSIIYLVLSCVNTVMMDRDGFRVNFRPNTSHMIPISTNNV